MKTVIPQLPTTAEQVNDFLLDLHLNKELYHVEDSAHDIIDGETDKPKFTHDEATKLDAYMDRAFEICDVWSLSVWESVWNSFHDKG